MEVSGQLHTSAALPPGNSPGAHWTGGWVDPRASLDIMKKRKVLLLWDLKPGRPANSVLLYWLSFRDYSHINMHILINFIILVFWYFNCVSEHPKTSIFSFSLECWSLLLTLPSHRFAGDVTAICPHSSSCLCSYTKSHTSCIVSS
jgi:hypothetical protein